MRSWYWTKCTQPYSVGRDIAFDVKYDETRGNNTVIGTETNSGQLVSYPCGLPMIRPKKEIYINPLTVEVDANYCTQSRTFIHSLVELVQFGQQFTSSKPGQSAMSRSSQMDRFEPSNLLKLFANKSRSLPQATWWHLSTHDLPCFTIIKRSSSRTALWRHRTMLTTIVLLYSTMTLLVSVCEAMPALQLHGSSSSSSSSRILIWPDEIEDNALTKQNGEFVYKQATAAEKQEQKSSSSIFFWPSSHGGNHHHRPSRNYASSVHLGISSLLLVLCLTFQWTLHRYLR